MVFSNSALYGSLQVLRVVSASNMQLKEFAASKTEGIAQG